MTREPSTWGCGWAWADEVETRRARRLRAARYMREGCVVSQRMPDGTWRSINPVTLKAGERAELFPELSVGRQYLVGRPLPDFAKPGV